MKRILTSFIALLSMAFPMWSAVDGKFSYSYPAVEDLPYNLGYQYSVYDLKESEIEGWKVMTLTSPVTLTYQILSEEKKTVQVVCYHSYLDLDDIVIPDNTIDQTT